MFVCILYIFGLKKDSDGSVEGKIFYMCLHLFLLKDMMTNVK